MKVALIILFSALTIVSANQVAVDASLAGDTGMTLHRNKRQTCGASNTLTSAEAVEAINAHNLFRGREPATNMLKVIWNDELGARVQEWVNQCIWGHGLLTDCSGNTIGQNLFVISQSTLNLTAMIEFWYNERDNWDFTTSTCLAGKVCGHWTQLVKARSYQVGCAYNLCPSMNVNGAIKNNVLLAGCDYAPGGNVAGSSIYEQGTACTHCDFDGTGGGYKCDSNLCAKCTPATDPLCKCGTPLACVNGSWDAGTCSCTCNKGYYGYKCEKSCTCADANTQCAQLVKYCTLSAYKTYMTQNCQKTCTNLCNPPPLCSA